MEERSHWLTACGMLLALVLPFGVNCTAVGLTANPSWPWLGLPLLAAGVVGVVYMGRAVALLRAEAERTAEGGSPAADFARRQAREMSFLDTVMVPGFQLITFLLFLLLLDGHVVLFKAACWLYLVYLAGAVAVLAWHRGRPSGWGLAYLRWAWVPILAFGVPLAFPPLQNAGLVPFGPVGR